MIVYCVIVYAQKKTSQVLTLKNCIEALSYASTAYVVRRMALVSFRLFCKYLGKWFTAPPAENCPYAYGMV